MVKASIPGTASLSTGEIWLINLDPTVGSEIQKTRPCVVISPPEMPAILILTF